MDKLQTFIDKDTFKTITGCVLVVEAATECVKYLIPSIDGIRIAFVFSIVVALVKLLLDNDYTRNSIILALLNIIPIFLCSVGVYESGIKPLEKLIMG